VWSLPPYTYATINGTITITGYTGPGGVVTIPDTITGLPVTTIGLLAFAYSHSLTSVIIPGSVTNIGWEAFAYCTSLTNVTIPSSVTTIETGAFTDCSSLNAITVDPLSSSYSSVDGVLFNKDQTVLIEFPGGQAGTYTIPSSVTSIGDQAFMYCWGLTGVSIPNTVTSIGNGVFAACEGLASVTIPNSVTNIGGGAFSDCTSLTAITVDPLNPAYSSVDGVLFNKSQTTIIACPGGKAGDYTIPSSVSTIGDGAFESCGRLTSLTIPNSITTIAESAVAYCTSLTNITIANSVTNIANGAFMACSSLTSVTIPNSVTSIGASAFLGCSALEEVYFQGNAPVLGSLVFDSGSQATAYYLPTTTGWSSAFGGLPAVLWNPQAQTSDASFGLRNNKFGFNITGTADIPIVIEGSATLASPAWVPLQSCTLTNGLIYFGDAGWTNYPARFYRIRSP